MSPLVNPVPEEFHTITPHIVVRGVALAVQFYRDAFGAVELYRNLAPDGESIIHSEVLLGDSRFFLVDENPEWDAQSPAALGGSPITLHLYVGDVDNFVERSTAAGAEILMPVADCFWGDRYAILRDPFGHRWSVASRIEDLSPEQIQLRAREFFQQ